MNTRMLEKLENRREKARDAMLAEWCHTPESRERFAIAEQDFDEADRRLARLLGRYRGGGSVVAEDFRSERRAVSVDFGD